MIARLRAAGLIVPSLFTIVGLAILCGLGQWQLDRKAWKEGLIGALKSRANAPPVGNDGWSSLACDAILPAADGRSCEYRPVVLRGQFTHGEERHVFTSGGPSTGGRPGYLIMTPLEFSVLGAKQAVYVNRGFVPEAAKTSAQRQAGQLTGDLEITGLLRSAEPAGSFTPPPDTKANRYFNRDPATFAGPELAATAAGQDPTRFYIDQTGEPPSGGLPKPVGGKIEFSNRHLEYALTWFGLAATLASVFIAFAWARLRPSE